MAGPNKEISDVDELSSYLDRMGDLHDCVINSIVWKPAKTLIDVGFIDINANFKGLPEYMGPVPCTMSFSGVRGVELRLSSQDGRLRIYEASASEASGRKLLKMRFSPSGELEISFISVTISDLG
jgi:hypothetical protein